MNSLAVFPGQGSQSEAMAKHLLAEFPYTKSIFEEASDAISFDVLDLCSNASQTDLNLTENTQPALLATSMAYFGVLQKEIDYKPVAVAGHSLGEYSALVASSRISFFRAMQLVRERGKAMQAAVPVGLGAMSAVMGSSPEVLEKACAETSQPDSVVSVANFNSPQQTVVSGHKLAVDRLKEHLNGVKFIDLPVSAPFHSPLMHSAKERMRPLINDSEWQASDLLIAPNVSGEFTKQYQQDSLIEQIDSSVRWMQTLQNSSDLQLSHMIEVGPGRVLSGLAKKTLKTDCPELVSLTHDGLVNFIKSI